MQIRAFTVALKTKGLSVPVHVVKTTGATNCTVFCEHTTCSDEKDAAMRGGNPSYECDHLKSMEDVVEGTEIELRHETLAQLEKDTIFTESRRNEMLSMKEKSKEQMTPFVVQIPSLVLSSKRQPCTCFVTIIKTICITVFAFSYH